jgi:hypothetical protein
MHGAAVAGAVGTAEFIELGYGDTDQTPFQPEGSALSVPRQVVAQGTRYTVPVVTLDHEMPRYLKVSAVAPSTSKRLSPINSLP